MKDLFWPEIHGQAFDPEAALGLGLCATGTLDRKSVV